MHGQRPYVPQGTKRTDDDDVLALRGKIDTKYKGEDIERI